MKIDAINKLSLEKVKMNNSRMNEGPVTEPTTESENYSMNGLEIMANNNVAFGRMNIAKVGRNAIIGLSMLAGAAMMTSCEKDEYERNVNVEQVVNVQVDNSAVVAELVALRADFAKAMEYLIAQGYKMDRIISILIDYGAKFDEIAGLLGDNYDAVLGLRKDNKDLQNLVAQAMEIYQQGHKEDIDVLTEVLAAIHTYGKQNNEDNAQIIALAKAQLDKLGEMDENQKAASARMLKAINGLKQAVDFNTVSNAFNAKHIIDAVTEVGLKVTNKINDLSEGLFNYLATIVENQEALGEKADKLIESADVIIENQDKLGEKADALIELNTYIAENSDKLNEKADTLIETNTYIAKNVDKLGKKADKLIEINKFTAMNVAMLGAKADVLIGTTSYIAQNVDKLGKKADVLINITGKVAKDVNKLGKSADTIVKLLGNLVKLQEKPIVVNVDIQPLLDAADAIIDKFDSLPKALQNAYDSLLEAINANTEAVNNNTAGDKENTEKILNAINGLGELGNALLDDTGALNDKAAEAVDWLAKLANKPNAPASDLDMADLKDFLRTLTNAVITNNKANKNEIIDAINNKDFSFVHECDHSELILKLEDILRYLKTRNEGITGGGSLGDLEDLDDLFG